MNVHTYAVTPFQAHDVLQVDYDRLALNLEFLIQRGMQVIAVGGGTGEIETLCRDELEMLAKTALEVVDDRALVIACLPGNLSDAVHLIQRYERLGIPLVLGMPPLVRSQVPGDLRGVWDYYHRLTQAASLPLMPYNTQGWPAEFLVELADIEAIIGVKDPCHVPHAFFSAIQLLGDRFVWVGNKRHDPGVAQLRYQMGMQGFTSGQSNFWPEPELEIHRAAQQRDWERIIAIQNQVAALERLRMAHDDAAMVKAAMDIVGLHGGRVRPPRRDLTAAARAALEAQLAEIGVPVQDGAGR